MLLDRFEEFTLYYNLNLISVRFGHSIVKFAPKNRTRHKIGIYLSICNLYWRQFGARGGVVVKALRYKPAGRGFDSQWCHWNFSVT